MEALNSQTNLDDLNLNIDSFQGGLECNVDEVSFDFCFVSDSIIPCLDAIGSVKPQIDFYSFAFVCEQLNRKENLCRSDAFIEPLERNEQKI